MRSRGQVLENRVLVADPVRRQVSSCGEGVLLILEHEGSDELGVQLEDNRAGLRRFLGGDGKDVYNEEVGRQGCLGRKVTVGLGGIQDGDENFVVDRLDELGSGRLCCNIEAEDSEGRGP